MFSEIRGGFMLYLSLAFVKSWIKLVHKDVVKLHLGDYIYIKRIINSIGTLCINLEYFKIVYLWYRGLSYCETAERWVESGSDLVRYREFTLLMCPLSTQIRSTFQWRPAFYSFCSHAVHVRLSTRITSWGLLSYITFRDQILCRKTGLLLCALLVNIMVEIIRVRLVLG